MSKTRSNISCPAFFPAPPHPLSVRILRPTPIIIPNFNPLPPSNKTSLYTDPMTGADTPILARDLIGKKWEKRCDVPKKRPKKPIEIEIAIKEGGYTDFQTLPSQLKKTAAFENYCQILGEAIKNSYDSKAENITVSIECVSASQLTITLQDNGVGFGEILEKGYLRFALHAHRDSLNSAAFEAFLKRYTNSEAPLESQIEEGKNGTDVIDKAETLKKLVFDEQKAIEEMLENSVLRSLLKRYLQEQVSGGIESRAPLDYKYILNGGARIISDKRKFGDQVGGSGLGLALLWRCMDQNKGNLHICNKEEGGAIIIISSPLETSKRTWDHIREAHRTYYHNPEHSPNTPTQDFLFKKQSSSPNTPVSRGELKLRPSSALARSASVFDVERCSPAEHESVAPVSSERLTR